MKTVCASILALTFAATAVAADCPSNPPSIEGRVSFADGDQKVGTAWLEKSLAGHRVKFSDGTEHYNDNGTYTYKAGNQSWDAPGYKFYSSGLRCIDYATPRFDLYVVNDGKLVLINSGGSRLVGKILK